MRVSNKAAIIGLIGIAMLATSVSADRGTLTDNDWNGMTQTEVYAGSIYYGDDLEEGYTFRHPAGVLPLEDGSIIVADTVNQMIKRVVDGEVVAFSGFNYVRDENGKPVGALVDGAGDAATYHTPLGLDMDEEGNIYVADAGNHAIRKIAPDGSVTTLAGNGVLGHDDGAAEEASFYYPSDVAVAGDGTVYVADTLNHVIRKIDPDGDVSTLNAVSERVIEIHPGVLEASGDFRDGPLPVALFNEPSGLALDEAGNLYVSDTGNQRIRYIDLESGTVTTVAGASYANEATGRIYEETALYAEGFYKDGPASEALFYSPKGIAFTEEGGLLIADSENHVVRYLLNGQVTTVAGTPERYGFVNGIEQNNRLYRPVDVAVTSEGRMLIADSYNNVIRKVDLYKLPEQVRESSNIQVVYGEVLITFDAQPEVLNGRTMVPVRMIAEALGYTVDFHAEEQIVTLSSDDHAIDFQLGQLELAFEDIEGNMTDMQLDAAPYAKDGRTYVPVRFFAEVVGMDVQWVQDEQVVVIRDKVSE